MNGAPGLRRPPAEPADAAFWFGVPLPEDALPPLDPQRNGHHVAPGLLPPTPADTRYPPAAPRPAATGAPGDRGRRGPADAGPPSAFFTPVDADEVPAWPTPADSPSLRFPPVAPPDRHAAEPVQRRPQELPVDAEPTEVIPAVPPVPSRPEPADPGAYTPRRAAPEAAEPASPEPAAEPDRPDEFQPKHGKHRKQKKQPLWRELVTLVAVALLLTFLIQHFIGRVYSIPSGSMEQTLHGCPGCTGDRVFVDKMVYDFRDPLPGDVVVFQGPNSWTGEQVDAVGDNDNPIVRGLQYVGSLIGIAPPDERDFVKRVIAIGGQTVECCDAEMRVLVDGKPLDEPYVYWESGGPDERQRFAPVTVPEGTLWVMGDNRANSADSRIQGGGGIRGVVPITKVIGKVRAIVLPPSRWQGVGDHNPQAHPAIAAPAWQQGLPAGLGFAAAWPVLWVGRRVKKSLTSRKAD